MPVFSTKTRMPTPDDALPGRAEAMSVINRHYVNGNPIIPPFPEGLEMALFGLGCFWGAERKFWQTPGVYSTAVGYAGGYTPNPTYEEVCTGRTGHNEVVRVIYDPQKIRYEGLLNIFWEAHDPTQGMRQGNDFGTQYRSGIYTYNAIQQAAAKALHLPEVRARLEALGNEIVGSTPEEFDAKYKADLANYAKIVEQARVPLQD